jgi:hypothetical protein
LVDQQLRIRNPFAAPVSPASCARSPRSPLP